MKSIIQLSRITLSLILVLLWTCSVSAQLNLPEGRKVSYAQMWAEILNSTEKVYTLENATIIKQAGDDELIESFRAEVSTVETEVVIWNCTFLAEEAGWLEDYSLQVVINGFHFKQGFTIGNSSNIQRLIIENCEFNNGFSFTPADNVLELQLMNCDLRGKLEIMLPEKPTKTYPIDTRLDIDNCQLLLKNSNIIRLHNNSDIFIDNSVFKADSSVNLLAVSGQLKSIKADSNTFGVNLDFTDLILTKHVEFKNSTFSNVCFKSVTFPSITNSYIRWQQFQKGLSIIEKQHLEMIDYKMIETRPMHVFDGLTYDSLSNQEQYDELMASYAKFFRDYRERGDLVSANACYVSMKDVQTAMQQNLYKKNKSIDTWLYWKMNVFLRYFADYGTNPVKAIIVSIRAILLFAFLYFFFYSSWDKINRSFLISQHRKLLRYFKTKQSLKDFYTEEHENELKNYQDYKRELKSSKHLPYFIRIFGKPLYSLSLLKFRLMTWLFRRIDILHTSWEELPAGKRIKVGFKAFISLSIYIFYLIFVRIVNSIALSINAFSTLGFGDIPVVGLSRYIAIIEGFIGWFLLSIFSVSLISQILQS